MKKLIKISMVVTATILLVFNVSFNLDGNKLSVSNVDMGMKNAEASIPCYYFPMSGNCQCSPLGEICYFSQTCDYLNRCFPLE